MGYRRATSLCSRCANISARSSRASTVASGSTMVSKASTMVSKTQKMADSSYSQIKSGLRKSNPAAVVLWAFHKLGPSRGLTSRRVIGFLKQHYRVADNPRKTGWSIGAMIRTAEDFGLLVKRGNKYFLTEKAKERK